MGEPSFSNTKGGMREVMRVAVPLVLASSGHAFRLLADRVMLAKYSPEAIAASLPAGMLCFSFMAFFIGTAGYVNTFVAQFTGANQQKSIGLAVWQGIYLSAVGGVIVAALSLFAVRFFALMGHEPAVQVEEVRYFKTLCWFSFPGIALSSLNAFWSGRGRTRVTMLIELFCAVINISLNALLIFGRWGLPELGIRGAAIATIAANTAGLVLAFSLFLSRENRRAFYTWSRRALDLPLLRRLIRFGLPSGLQFGLDMLAFNAFVALLGSFGTVALEATNTAFGVNALCYIPLVGFGIAISIMVGQAVGAGDIPLAQRSVRSGLILALIYNAAIAATFLSIPDTIVSVFIRPGDASQVEALDMARRCLLFMAAFLLFDAVYLVYMHAIKGAGDTAFTFRASIFISWGTLVLPSYLAVRYGMTFWTLWIILGLHVVLAAAFFAWRYFQGKWKTMTVIERPPLPDLSVAAESDLHADRGI